jgi:hypothetical protein
MPRCRERDPNGVPRLPHGSDQEELLERLRLLYWAVFGAEPTEAQLRRLALRIVQSVRPDFAPGGQLELDEAREVTRLFDYLCTALCRVQLDRKATRWKARLRLEVAYGVRGR